MDKLNNACLEWLDGDGNGQLHTYTKKVPREMIKDEYRKLIKVYEKRNTDVLVTTPQHSVIEYLDNHYKLPDEAVPDDERVRVERSSSIIGVDDSDPLADVDQFEREDI